MIDEVRLHEWEKKAKCILEDLEVTNWGKPRVDAKYDPVIGMNDDLYTPRERDLHSVLTDLPNVAAALREAWREQGSKQNPIPRVSGGTPPVRSIWQENGKWYVAI